MEVQYHLLLGCSEWFDGIAVLHLAVGQHEQERERLVWAGTALSHLEDDSKRSIFIKHLKMCMIQKESANTCIHTYIHAKDDMK